jgi:hypothetical protein
MRNSKIALTGALIAFTWLVGFAQTAPVHCRTECAVDHPNVVQANHMWQGQDHCWYSDGWNGAGWHVCGSSGHHHMMSW